MKIAITALLFCLLATGTATAQDTHSPYAHESSAQLKTLSQSEVDDLLTGEGMGLARAAELNRHPGPKHVLDLADSLQLTAGQRRDVERIFSAMKAEAIELGQRVLEAESALDTLFGAGNASAGSVADAVGRIARLGAELRVLHLSAHLTTRALLTEHQVHEYDRLRGYGAGHVH